MLEHLKIGTVVKLKRRALILALALATFSGFAQEPPRAQSGIVLIAIHSAGDSFAMGDGTFGPGANETLASDYSIAKFLVTNGQFGQFVSNGGYAEQSYWTTNGWAWKSTKNKPAYWTDGRFNGTDQPVVGVSWYEAVAFCNWLSVREVLAPAYDSSGRVDLTASGYRLPTEVEWEYAAAKGAPGERRRVYPWGDKWDPSLAVCQVKPDDATRSANVGSKSPQGDTPQGLTDMAGNVWEWCSDNYEGNQSIRHASLPDRYFFLDDSPWHRFVLRGGSWVIDFANGLRSAFRSFSCPPGLQYNVCGFRVVRR